MKSFCRTLFAISAICFFFFSFQIASFAATDNILKFEQGDTLEDIRAIIKHNGYKFTVGHNWVYDMSPEEKARFFSRHRPVSPRKVLAQEDISPLSRLLGKQLPASFDWRNYNGHSYIGPIRDQGSCGACYAFSACAAAEGAYNLANGKYDENCSDFSESFIMWCLGRLPEYEEHFFGCDGADYDYYELEALTKEGICKEEYFPYITADPGYCTHWGDPATVFESWHRIPCNDIEAIKTAIMTYGVVDAAVEVTEAFQGYASGIYADSNTACDSDPCYYTPTNHAVALVGWDDNGGNGYWILRNSWGTSWGEEGYMRIKYTSARVACEACYLVGSPCIPGNPTMSILSPGEGFSCLEGKEILISVSIVDCDPVTRATVNVRPTNGDSAFILSDNGIYPDAAKNDGIYCAYWTPVNDGVATLNIEASGFGTTLTGSVSGSVVNSKDGNVLIAVDINGNSQKWWDPASSYESAINAAGYTVKNKIAAPANGDIPWPDNFTSNEYDVVLVLTGENWHESPGNISPSDETALGNYLETGGCVLIVGQDLVWGAHPSWGDASGFFKDYMGVASVKQDSVNATTVDAFGASSSILEGINFTVNGASSGGSFLANDLWIDTLIPVGGAMALICVEGADPCAVYYEKGSFKTVFSSLEIGSADSASFHLIINKIMEWFMDPGGSSDDADDTPVPWLEKLLLED